MATPTIIQGDVIVTGTLSPTGLNIPNGSVTASDIQANARLPASVLQPMLKIPAELFAEATTVVALTSRFLFTANAAGTLIGFFGVITGAIATGSDRTIAVDLQKSTGGGAFASVLTDTINFTNASTLLVSVNAVLNSTSYVAGDSFIAIVTVAGASDAQATGLGITLQTAEYYV